MHIFPSFVHLLSTRKHQSTVTKLQQQISMKKIVPSFRGFDAKSFRDFIVILLKRFDQRKIQTIFAKKFKRL